jgi:hypothetical protein
MMLPVSRFRDAASIRKAAMAAHRRLPADPEEFYLLFYRPRAQFPAYQ